MKLALQVPTQYSNFVNVIRNIQNKLVNRALKSDLSESSGWLRYCKLSQGARSIWDASWTKARVKGAKPDRVHLNAPFTNFKFETQEYLPIF